jgi:enterochelin esterase-like enzyme
VHYMEYNGGHDYVSWQGTLSEGLQALLGENHIGSRRKGMKNG